MTGRRRLLQTGHAAAAAVAIAASMGAAGAGCDHFRVESFHGSRVLMTLAGIDRPTPADRHIEVWVRSVPPLGGISTIARVVASEGGKEADGRDCLPADYYQGLTRFKSCPSTPPEHRCLPQAFTLASVLGPYHKAMGDDGQLHAFLDDPCIIDRDGNLLWSKDAIDPAAEAIDPKTIQTQGEAAARALQKHIDDVVLNQPLIALVTWDDAVEANRPTIAADASATTRLCACRTFWNNSAAAYTPNPRQITAPIHGNMLGTVDFVTTQPPQAFGGISFPTAWSLPDARELWLTETAASFARLKPGSIDCGSAPDTCRGRVLLDGKAEVRGRGATYFELTAPDGAPISGSATIEYDLDRDPNQF